MGKKGGGTRNYTPGSKAWNNRHNEFNSLVATGSYRDTMFHNSGGYYVIHNGHKNVDNEKTKETFAATALAEHGYRAYLMPDGSYVDGFKKNDGFIERTAMDIKTINSAGKWTIHNALREASMQSAGIALLVQNTKDMTRDYVAQQLDSFRNSADGKNNVTLKAIWIVSMDGKRIHKRAI